MTTTLNMWEMSTRSRDMISTLSTCGHSFV